MKISGKIKARAKTATDKLMARKIKTRTVITQRAPKYTLPESVVTTDFPKMGGLYRRNSNGRTCTVVNVVNTWRQNAKNPRKFPLMVIYMHQDGGTWARPMKAFNEKFSKVRLNQRAPKPKTSK